MALCGCPAQEREIRTVNLRWSDLQQPRIGAVSGGILQVLVLASPGAEQGQEEINKVIRVPISNVLKA